MDSTLLGGTKTVSFIDRLLAMVPTEARELVQQAVSFVLDRHAGQYRLGGEPQVDHVLRVGLAAAEYATAEMPEQLCVLALAGILHDTLEDTPTRDEELAGRFDPEVARTVRALSHEEEEEPDELYLSRVAMAGKLAVLVKRFDRLDNLRALAKAPADFRARKVTEVKAALPIWQSIDPEGSCQIEEALAEVPPASVKEWAESFIGPGEKVPYDPKEIGMLFEAETPEGAPVYWVWWETESGHDTFDRDGSPEWCPDRKGTFILFKGKRYDQISWNAAELCIQLHYPLTEGPRLEAEGREAKHQADKAEREAWETRVQRAKNSQTLGDWLLRLDLDAQLKAAIGRLRVTTYFCGNKREVPVTVPALPAAERVKVVSQEVQALFPLFVEGDFGPACKEEERPPLVCPFCGQPVGKNQPCDSCLEKFAPDEYQDAKGFMQEVKDWWPDPLTGLEEYRKIVRKHFRLFQHQCGCGQWTDASICPQCQEIVDRRTAGSRLLSATKKFIGKKIRLTCENWPVQVIDVLVSVKAEVDPETLAWKPEHVAEFVFQTGTTAKFRFYAVEEEGSSLRLKNFVHKGGNEDILVEEVLG